MSDDEDNQSLINEIQALENALDHKGCTSSSVLKESVFLKVETSYEKDQIENSNIEEIDDDFRENDYYENYNCKDLQDLLELNKKLIELISLNHDKLTTLLDDCMNKQRLIEDQISKHTSSWVSKVVSFNAGMPYFKDKNYFTAKRNEDTETKIRNGELRLSELQRINRWSQVDKSNLLKMIRHEVTLTLLSKNEPEEIYIDNKITKTSQLPNDVKTAIGSLGSMKFDWLKIANELPGNKHSAEECEVMWNIFLHPDVNKQKWTSKEDKKLNRIAEEYEFEDWDTIAKVLKTNRSGYQCFIRYNTNNWKNLMKGQYWTPNDDKILLKLVKKLKIGDYIPWGYIASCMMNWTKQQVYFHWTYSLAPHLKKGRFSAEEDKQLLNAVAKYGVNFTKISALVMTHRTSIQLKEHFQIIKTKRNHTKKIWKIEEDECILELHKKYGPNWKKIASQLPNVTRIQARQRHAALLRYQSKGIGLKSMRRDDTVDTLVQSHTTMTYTTNTPWSRENKEIVVTHLKIDDQLINFFKKDNLHKKQEQNKKSYHPDKLNEDKKKLYNVLLQCNANLNIPEILNDDSELSEINQQLLIALQNYAKRKKAYLDENVEAVRLQMFGPLEKLPDEQRFIPPLPFGFHVPKTKRQKYNGLNYSLDTTEFHQVVLIMLLETSEHVAEYLGEDTELQFEKFKKIMTSPTSNIKKQKIYSLKCKPFANSLYFFDESQEIDNNQYNMDTAPLSAEKRKFNWELNRFVSSNLSVDKVIVDSPMAPIIEPSRSTLQAYQEMLLISGNFSLNSNESNINSKLTPRGRQALDLFKRRYEQLFHIPTGLSRIIPPDIVDESVFLPALEKLKKQNLKKKRLNK